MILVLHFSMRFLGITRRRHPMLTVMFIAPQIAAFIVILASLVMEYGWVVQPLNMIGMLSSLIAMTAGLMFLMKGFRPARFYLLALCALGISSVLFLLVRTGMAPDIILTEYGLEIGMLGLSFFWALALIDRVTLLRREREQAYIALRESESTARVLLNSLISSIALLDLNGTFLDLNTLFAHSLRASREDIIGHTIFEVTPGPVTMQRWEKIQQVITNKEAVRFEDERRGIWYDNLLASDS